MSLLGRRYFGVALAFVFEKAVYSCVVWRPDVLDFMPVALFELQAFLQVPHLDRRDEAFADIAALRRHLGVTTMARKDALNSLREILTMRREALRMALTGDMSLLNELASQTKGDVVDWALDSVQDELSSQLAEVESRELVMIEHALKRMDQGDYGVCETCEQNIPLARLQALPYTTHCVQCQRRAEESGGRGGAAADWSKVMDEQADDLRSPDINLRTS